MRTLSGDIAGCNLPLFQKVLNGQPDVLGDLAKKDRRDVAAGVKWESRASPVRVPVLFVRPALSDFRKAEPIEYSGNFAGTEYRNAAHDYATTTLCVPTNSASNSGSPSSRSMDTTS